MLTALAVSGLPTDRFAFEGFLPRKAGDRARRLAELAGDRRTLVFFEGPSRLAASLAAIAEAFGADRPAAVCRELTKLHEEVRRGGARASSRRGPQQGVRGEICIVVGGAGEQQADAGGALERVLGLAASGTRLKDAAALVAAETGLGKRDLYEAALAARSSRPASLTDLALRPDGLTPCRFPLRRRRIGGPHDEAEVRHGPRSQVLQVRRPGGARGRGDRRCRSPARAKCSSRSSRRG